MRRRSALLLLLSALAAPLARAADPQLELVLPRGAPRGSELVISLYGQRLGDALELRSDRAEILCVGLEEVKPERVRVRLRIAPEAPAGAALLQLRCASGTTGYASFHIGALASVEETEPNDTLAQAQKLELDRCVHGVLRERDADLYRVELASADRIACELQGARLGDRAFDAQLEWLDEQGRVLAEVDDDARARLDPVLVREFTASGTYFLRVRELTYGGGGNARYLLHLGRFPRPAIALPLGAPAGSSVELRWLGGGPEWKQVIALPAGLEGEHLVFARDERGEAPTPQRLWISPHENRFEDARAQPLDASSLLALNGVLSAPGEADDWPLQCAANQTLVLELRARELGSPLDAVLEILDESGTWRAGVDDGRSPDPRLQFRCPAAGVFRARVRDLLGRGGETFAYRLELGVAPSSPRLELPTSRGRPLPTAEVPRGGRGAVVLEWRQRPPGALESLRALGLPEGVALQLPALEPALEWLPLVFEAQAEAPLAFGALRFEAEGRVESEGAVPWSGAIAFEQPVPLLRVENDRPYVIETARELALGVVEAPPFSLALGEAPTPLVLGGPLRWEVALERAEGFDAQVRVELLRTPAGVAAQALRFEKGETKKMLLLEARGDAPERLWPIVLIAEASTPTGTRRCASELRALRVVKPWASLALGRVRAEPEQTAELELELRPAQDLPAGTLIELLDLPAGITVSAPITCAPSGVQKLAVPLAFAKEAPVGRHRSFRARLAVPCEGGFLEHRFGGGEIRLDAPLPPRAGDAPNAPAAAPARGTVAKPKT
ncbi:MAG: hypothetical protein IPN34_05940 [Planctomycetes bacterium]|nr:hypothetical protein [Planctomycetota bacterium]